MMMPRCAALLAVASALCSCGSESSSPTSIGSGGVSSAVTAGNGGAGSAGSVPTSGNAGLSDNASAGNLSTGGVSPGSAGADSSGANMAGATGGVGTAAGSGGALSAAGSGGTSGGGSSSGGGASSSFICNLVFGVSPTGQWFDSGFLSLVDAARWESIWVAHHYTNFWADPNDSAWSMPFDPYPGPAHGCAQNSNAPDRVLFVAVNWQYTTAAAWESDLEKIVRNLQSRYPSLRRIELMTLTRAPGNALCSANGSTETIIPSWTDVAIVAIAAKFPTLVVQAPKFEVPHCSDFLNDGAAPQYTAAGAADVAQTIGAYYAAHP